MSEHQKIRYPLNANCFPLISRLRPIAHCANSRKTYSLSFSQLRKARWSARRDQSLTTLYSMRYIEPRLKFFQRIKGTAKLGPTQPNIIRVWRLCWGGLSTPPFSLVLQSPNSPFMSEILHCGTSGIGAYKRRYIQFLCLALEGPGIVSMSRCNSQCYIRVVQLVKWPLFMSYIFPLSLQTMDCLFPLVIVVQMWWHFDSYHCRM